MKLDELVPTIEIIQKRQWNELVDLIRWIWSKGENERKKMILRHAISLKWESQRRSSFLSIEGPQRRNVKSTKSISVTEVIVKQDEISKKIRFVNWHCLKERKRVDSIVSDRANHERFNLFNEMRLFMDRNARKQKYQVERNRANDSSQSKTTEWIEMVSSIDLNCSWERYRLEEMCFIGQSHFEVQKSTMKSIFIVGNLWKRTIKGDESASIIRSHSSTKESIKYDRFHLMNVFRKENQLE